jgi:hypothetical protein
MRLKEGGGIGGKLWGRRKVCGDRPWMTGRWRWQCWSLYRGHHGRSRGRQVLRKYGPGQILCQTGEPEGALPKQHPIGLLVH